MDILIEKCIDLLQIKIGHWTDKEKITGCSVIIFEKGATASVDISGGAPGTREIALLSPEKKVDKINAIYLGGGSAFGLAGAEGLMLFLREKRMGFKTSRAIIPIIPGAIIYDLLLGSSTAYPDSDAGYLAGKNAFENELILEGNYGCATGATAGKILGIENSTKTGIGFASDIFENLVIASFVILNPIGDIIDPSNGKIIAGTRKPGENKFVNTWKYLKEKMLDLNFSFFNTTLVVVMTNARLNKAQCKRVSQMVNDALSKTISPAHTNFDGDVIFCASTNPIKEFEPSIIGMLATEVTIKAILNSVKRTSSLGGVPSWKDIVKMEGK